MMKGEANAHAQDICRAEVEVRVSWQVTMD